MPTPRKDKLLRREAVIALTALSPATFTRIVAAGEFPQPVRPSPRTVAWRETEVMDWIKTLPRVVRGAQTANEVN
jgi:prophage regulatory protein